MNPNHYLAVAINYLYQNRDGWRADAAIGKTLVSICEYRAQQGTTGPLFLGMDTHALSEAAFRTAIEVFAANGVAIRIQAGMGYLGASSLTELRDRARYVRVSPAGQRESATHDIVELKTGA